MTPQPTVIDIPASLATALPSQESLQSFGSSILVVAIACAALWLILAIVFVIGREVTGEGRKDREKCRLYEDNRAAAKERDRLAIESWKAKQAAAQR